MPPISSRFLPYLTAGATVRQTNISTSRFQHDIGYLARDTVVVTIVVDGLAKTNQITLGKLGDVCTPGNATPLILVGRVALVAYLSGFSAGWERVFSVKLAQKRVTNSIACCILRGTSWGWSS